VISFRFFGEVSYARGLELQAEAFTRGGGEIIGLTHQPVMTLGRHGHDQNLLLSRALLEARGVQVVQTDRGGDVTYHGPEQVIVYPILALASARQTVKSFAALIEQAMIGYLQTLGIEARTEAGAPGIFVGPKKIGFLGLRVKEGISTHGLSLNLGGSLEPFSWMNPCGYASLPVTSIEQLGHVPPSHEAAARGLAHQLIRLLQDAALST